VLHSSKIPLVLSIKVAHLRSLLFRNPDGINCVATKAYLAIIAKLSQNRVVHSWASEEFFPGGGQ